MKTINGVLVDDQDCCLNCGNEVEPESSTELKHKCPPGFLKKMTIPELPDHPRFRMTEFGPTFCVRPESKRECAQFHPLELLTDFDLESCVAIARCFWMDKRSPINVRTVDAEEMFNLDEQCEINSENWRLYGESRK